MALGQIKIQTKTSRVKADSFCSYIWFAHRFVIVKLFARGFMTQSEANFFLSDATREIQEYQYQTGVSEKLTKKNHMVD